MFSTNHRIYSEFANLYMFAVFQPPRLDLQHLLPTITLASFFFLSSSSFSFPPSANYATSGSLHMDATLLRNRFHSTRSHRTRCTGLKSFQQGSGNGIAAFMDVRRQEDRVVLASEPQTRGNETDQLLHDRKVALQTVKKTLLPLWKVETAHPPHTSRPNRWQ